MSILKPALAISLVYAFSVLNAQAEEFVLEVPADKNNPEEVFAYQGDAVLTQVGIDAAFSKIPEEHRLLFIRDGAQVDRLVRNLMKTQVIALDALENGLADDPLVRERMIQAAYKELAEAWVTQLAENAPAADFEALAYEDYVANPEKYQSRPFVDVTHILISTQNRSNDLALELSESVREMALNDPESFEALVMEYSDDPAKVQNQGSYKRVEQGQMAPEFDKVAFEMTEEGSISRSVKTDYGYHVIRLDKRYAPRQKSFEEVQVEAVATMEQRHRANYQERYVKGLLAEGIVLPEGSVQVMLKRYFGENLENAPQY